MCRPGNRTDRSIVRGWRAGADVPALAEEHGVEESYVKELLAPLGYKPPKSKRKGKAQE